MSEDLAVRYTPPDEDERTRRRMRELHEWLSATTSSPESITFSQINNPGSWWVTNEPPETKQPDKKVRVKEEIEEGEVVKVVDLGINYNRQERDKFIGRCFRVSEINCIYPNGWYEVELRSLEPSDTNYYNLKARLQKLKGEVVNGDVGKTE